MTDAETLELLQLIADRRVHWQTGSSLRVRFIVVPDATIAPDRYYASRGIEIDSERTDRFASLSGRLYERDGFEYRDYGQVSLTPVGAALLAELTGPPKQKSIWDRGSSG